MIPENINKVVDAMARAPHSLDIGGWYRPIQSATHVLDINPYDTRMASMAFDPWVGGIEAREEIFDIRDWFDGRLRLAESLVRFDPIGRIRARLQRRGHFSPDSVDHPSDKSDVKYPYL